MPAKSLGELQEMVGWRSPAFAVAIEEGRVEAFADAVGDDDPVYRDEAAARARGLPGRPAPITFLGSLFFTDEETHLPDLTFDPESQLHAEQSFSVERPPVVGETLYGRVELVAVRQKERGDGGTLTFADLETEFRDEEGDLAVTATQTRMEVLDE
jgi:acyl dehydratase